MKIRPDYAEGHYALGVVLAQQKQLARAIEQFQLAIRLKPDYASAHYALGVALQKQGDRAGAERAFKLAQKLDSRLKPPSD